MKSGTVILMDGAAFCVFAYVTLTGKRIFIPKHLSLLWVTKLILYLWICCIATLIIKSSKQVHFYERGKNMKEKVQSFGRFLSGMVMPNIGAFIAWGLITALFIRYLLPS